MASEKHLLLIRFETVKETIRKAVSKKHLIMTQFDAVGETIRCTASEKCSFTTFYSDAPVWLQLPLAAHVPLIFPLTGQHFSHCPLSNHSPFYWPLSGQPEGSDTI